MSKRIDWPPKPYKPQDANVAGEPSWIYLRRFERDNALHGRIWTTCCGCGMEHLYVYSVLREPDGKWWMLKRAYDAGEARGWKNRHKAKPRRKK